MQRIDARSCSALVLAMVALAHCSAPAASPQPVAVAPQAQVESPASSGGAGAPNTAAPAAPGPVRYPGVGIRLDAPVSLNVWCGFLGYAFCRHCQPSDVATCNNAFVSACVGGRDSSMLTQRTLFDAQMCGNALQQANCTAVASGTLPAACQVAGGAEPDGEVDLWTWCSTLSQNFCRHCSPEDPDACIDAFVPACLARRDPHMATGRMRSEMRACGLQLETTSCASVTQGVLPPACRPQGS